jgi:GT2 family glycosyltransferase
VRSVLGTTGSARWHMTLIDDASPDQGVRAWLREFARDEPGVTVLENVRNLGFVQTVNLGMRLAGRRDVILLNSDTQVANDWLDRLRAAALARPSVGTVTPFSNNATICSYPQFCVDNTLPPGQDTAAMDRLCAGSNRGQAVEIPTAVGFCMYIRRACLDQVGEFDAANFGKGYGEENDFCLRATALGWKHLHALDVFVYHEGGASFKESRVALQANALAAIRRLHPGYEEMIREFVQQDPARPYREAIDQARAGA